MIKSITWKALLLLAVLAGLSCQNQTEPTDVTREMTTRVEVRDGSQKPVSGATVRWAISEPGAALTPFFPLPETSTGLFEGVIPVPLALANTKVVFEVTPPATPEFATAQPILDSVPVCQDTLLVYNFDRQQGIICGDVFDETLDLFADLTSQSSVTGCTPEYVNNSGVALAMSMVVNPPLSANATSEFFINGVVRPLNTLVAPGERFKLCFTFNFPAGAAPSQTSFDAVLTGLAAGLPCFTSNIRMNVETVRPQECQCPAQPPTFDYPSATTEDTVCTNAQERIVIPIGPFRNINDKCSLILKLSQNPSDGEFTLLALDGGSASERAIAPGGSISSIEVRFAPLQRQAYVKTMVYTVQLLNPDGTVTDCATPLRIVFHGRGGAGVCSVKATPGDTTLINIDSTMQQCVDNNDPAEVKYYCVTNVGDCAMTASAQITSGAPVFTVSPNSLVLQPGETDCFEVRFLPTTRDYWPPDGTRTNVIRQDFAGELTVTGLPTCSPAKISLTGKAKFPCLRFNDNCYKQWGSKGGEYKVGLSLLQGGSLLSEPRDVKDSLAIYVQSFDNNINPTSVTLASGNPTGGSPFARFRKVDNISLTQNENICQRSASYSALCDGNGTQTISGIVQGDVLLLTFELFGQKFCAVLWIRTIRLDRNNDPANAVPEVCFEVCYPI